MELDSEKREDFEKCRQSVQLLRTSLKKSSAENLESKKVNMKLMIESRVEKMKEFTDASEIRQEKATKEIDDSVSLFTSLIDRVQEAQIKLTWNIEDKLKKSQEKDEAMMQRLQQEINELQKKSSELDELSQSDDHLLFLQALNATSVTRDWSKVRVYSDLCVQTVRRAMNHLVHTFQMELKTLTETESVTFDPNTAGCRLMVTEFRKRLKYKKESNRSSSDDLGRFDCPMILGSQGFTCGRHYWEVEVGLRNDWDVGVAKETAIRTGKVALTPENGFFAVGKRGYDYRAHQTPIKAKLKRKRMKLQQTIQERLSKAEKVRRSVDLSGEKNPKEAQELVREVEEEICELQRKHSELEKLAQTEDNLRFLQV
ncbi:uncharacterized protein V6R79_018637 [Siganus canaliculatus]